FLDRGAVPRRFHEIALGQHLSGPARERGEKAESPGGDRHGYAPAQRRSGLYIEDKRPETVAPVRHGRVLYIFSGLFRTFQPRLRTFARRLADPPRHRLRGGTTMSVTTSEWAFLRPNQPARPVVESARVRPREEEFRLALDSYMARYVEQQRRRTSRVHARPANILDQAK